MRLLATAAVCVVIVGGLTGMSRQGRSAGGGSTVDRITHPTMTADQTCAAWVAWWQKGSGLEVDGATLEAISRCRETVDGAWIIADGVDDPALKRAAVAIDDAETAAARAALVEGLATFGARMSPAVRDALARVYDGSPDGVFGFVIEGRNLAGERETYERAVVATLASPDMAGVDDYIDWAIAREIAGYGALQARCQTPRFAWLHFACDGLERDMAIGATPWPWDLAEPWLIDTYLAEQRASA
jgi:hypothetical protein